MKLFNVEELLLVNVQLDGDLNEESTLFDS